MRLRQSHGYRTASAAVTPTGSDQRMLAWATENQPDERGRVGVFSHGAYSIPELSARSSTSKTRL